MANRFPIILDQDSNQLKELVSGDVLDLTGNSIVGVDSVTFADNSTAVKSTDVYTKTETDARIADVIGSAPEALDTLNELAAALGNDANFATTVTNQLTAIEGEIAQLEADNSAEHVALQAALDAEIASRISADATLQSAVNAAGAKRAESRTISSSDVTVYADSSVTPMIDPFGQSGWYFKNTVAGQKINWYTYINTKNPVDPLRPLGTDTATRGSISSIWAVVKIYSATSRPFVTIYSAPTGTGDAASWYKSRWVYELSTTPVTPTPPGTYLMHFGTDPGVHQHLPRLVMPNVNTNGRGPMSPTETLLMYAWSSNSAAAVNSQEFTIEQTGHTFGDRSTAYSLVQTGASLANLANESTARQAADAALQTSIEEEEIARLAADADLANSIAALSGSTATAIASAIDLLRLPVIMRSGEAVYVDLVSQP